MINVSALQKTVKELKANPDLLHDDTMKFFKEYLESLGAKIPEKSIDEMLDEEDINPPPMQPCKVETVEDDVVIPEKIEEKTKMEDLEDEEEEDEEEDEIEEDKDEPLPGDELDESQVIKGENKEVTDEKIDKANDLKSEAKKLFKIKKYEEAMGKYTEAILCDGTKAMLYAGRAECLIEMKKPNAAIYDCGLSLELNPNCAKALKARAKANSHLHKWKESIKDYNLANQIDWDEDTYEESKSVQEKVNIILERERKIKKRDARIKAKKEAKLRKQAEKKKKEKKKEKPEEMPGMGGMPGGMPGMGGMPGGMPGMGGMPGGMPGMGGIPPELLQKLMKDPELMKLMSKPGLMQKLQEIMKDPTKMATTTDPELLEVIKKMKDIFGDPSSSAPKS